MIDIDTLEKMSHKDFCNFLHNESPKFKPSDLIVSDLVWKAIVRAIAKGKNVAIVGPARCGKTYLARSAAKCLGRLDRFFTFNIGSTQDARVSLVGNTFFNKDVGTVFKPSDFVKAITTEYSVILLDELTRGSHDSWNLLMPVTDPTQRCFRTEEAGDSSPILLAKGATFISTMNIGMEYTSTLILDKALDARFPVKIEMSPLSESDELNLMEMRFPTSSEKQRNLYGAIAKIASETRRQVRANNSTISTFINTGSTLEMAELVQDGFKLNEISELVIYPQFSDDGGVGSERTFVKQLVQAWNDEGILVNKSLFDKKKV